MISFRAFESLIHVITGARARETSDHFAFLEFYQELVKIIPDDLAKDFGSISAPVRTATGRGEYRIELNVTDYLWWVAVIQEGARFIEPISTVQRHIWERLHNLAGVCNLTEEERSQLLKIMED